MALPWPGLLWDITAMEWFNMIDIYGDKKKMNTHETCNCSKRHWGRRITRPCDTCLKNLSSPLSSMIVTFGSEESESGTETFLNPSWALNLIVLDSLMIFQKQETRGTLKLWSERWRLSTCSKEVTRTLSTRKESFLMPHCVCGTLSINPRSQDSPNTWNQIQLHSDMHH